jgi:type II secretory ATPase GspE/PulE/Tfp pilus assembly ATPase PilB-like protein
MAKVPEPVLPPLKITPKGKWTPEQFQALKYEAGFNESIFMLADMIDRRTAKALLDYTRDAVAIRYEIDGIWHPLPPRDRVSGDAILVALKKLSELNPLDRRSRQESEFKMTLHGKKYRLRTTSQGTPTGERVLLEIMDDSVKLDSLNDIGMRDGLQKILKEWLARPKGLIVFSAPANAGLRTSWRAGLQAADRFIRDFVMVRDASAPKEDEIINVDAKVFDPAKGETATKLLADLLLKQPDAVVVPDVKDAETFALLIGQCQDEDKLVVTRIRANTAVEAALRLRQLAGKEGVEKYADSLIGFVNQRLIRKLCEQCKQPFQPPPQLLQRLGIPPGRVEVLFQEKQPLSQAELDALKAQKQEPPPPCYHCGAIGYRGRTGVFELVEATPEFKKALKERPQAEVLMQIAKKDGAKSGARGIQEEAILAVAKGDTSIQELQRVLRGGQPQA